MVGTGGRKIAGARQAFCSGCCEPVLVDAVLFLAAAVAIKAFGSEQGWFVGEELFVFQALALLFSKDG